jgi:lysophospholipase L1-like esterase
MNEELTRELADPLCITADEATRLLRVSPWRRLAVLGDSFAKGTGDPSPGYADTPWPRRVAAALAANGPEFAYLNTGVIGARTEQVRTEQLPQVLDFRPDLVNVAAGGNDLFAPVPDYDAVENDLDEIYSALREHGADIFAFTVANVFDAMPELAEFRDRMAALNERIRSVARKHHAVLIEMWDHPIRLRPTLMSADGIHFRIEGQAALASEIVRALSVAASDTVEA